MKIRKEPTNIKICSTCKVEKSFNEFGNNKRGWVDLQGDCHKWHCKTCDYQDIKKRHISQPHVRLFHLAKRRALKKGLSFTITMQDIKMKFPKDNICPVTKKPFEYDVKTRDQNATIDRADNNKGYTCDNIVIVSWTANKIKNNLTNFDIFKSIVNYYK